MIGLTGEEGLGIDLGSGPGTLIIELRKHTKLYWLNADINFRFFPDFVGKPETTGYGGRVSAIQADACARMTERKSQANEADRSSTRRNTSPPAV